MIGRLFRSSVAVRHLFHPRTYGPVSLWIIAFSAIASAGNFRPVPLLVWAGIHSVALFGAGAVLWLAQRAFQTRGRSEISVVWVLSVGAAAGAVKAFGTIAIESLAGLSGAPTEALATRSFGAVLAGMWVVTTVAFARSGQERLAQARTDVIRQNVAMRLTQDKGSPRPELSEALHALNELRKRLQRREKTSSQAQIRAMVDGTVRPLSRALWAVEDQRYPTPTVAALYQLALRSFTPRPGIIAPLWGLLTLSSLATLIGIVPAFVYSLSVGITSFFVFLMLRLGRTKSGFWALALVTSAGGVAVAIGFLIARVLNPTVGDLPLPLLVTSALWMVFAAIGSSMVSVAGDLRRVIARDLASHGTQSLIAERSSTEALYVSSQTLSRQLHGLVQSRLLGLAAAIEHRGLAVDAVDAELEAIADQLVALGGAVDGSLTPTNLSNQDEWQQLLEGWEGIVDIELAEESKPFVIATLRKLPESLEILREAITNAYRHGKATRVQVSGYSDSPKTFTFRVVDNGYGPRNGKPGLGSALLDAWSQGAWGLTMNPEGGAELRVTLPLEHPVGAPSQ